MLTVIFVQQNLVTVYKEVWWASGRMGWLQQAASGWERECVCECERKGERVREVAFKDL